MKKDITALIPVKKTSDRIKDKNIRRFSDTSLFVLKLKQISSLSCFDRLIVSTEDSELMKIAESYGFQIHSRDKKYSTSEISKIINNYNGVIAGTEGYSYNVIKNAKKLKVISRLGIGTDNIDLEFADKNKIKVFITKTQTDPPKDPVNSYH